MDIILQLLPVISSLTIWILYLIIKNQFKINLETEKNKIEFQYKQLYDQMIKQNELIEKLFSTLVLLEQKMNLFDRSEESLRIIDNLYNEIIILKNYSFPFVNKDFKNLLDSFFEGSSGMDFLNFFLLNRKEYETHKNHLIKFIQNEQENFA